MIPRSIASVLLVVCLLPACAKDDEHKPATAAVDAAPPAPKNLDLAKAALASAKAKYAKHEIVDTECGTVRSLEADFAGDKTPDAVKTSREIDAFCEIDVKLEGEVATLKTDSQKLADAVKKKDKAGEQMYAATVKDGCTNARDHLAKLAADKLDGEPKVAPLRAQIETLCAPPAPAKK